MCSYHIIHCANMFEPITLELQLCFFVRDVNSVYDQAETLRLLSQTEVSGFFHRKYLWYFVSDIYPYFSSFKEEESKRLNKKPWKALEFFLATIYLKTVQHKSSY